MDGEDPAFVPTLKTEGKPPSLPPPGKGSLPRRTGRRWRGKAPRPRVSRGQRKVYHARGMVAGVCRQNANSREIAERH